MAGLLDLLVTQGAGVGTGARIARTLIRLATVVKVRITTITARETLVLISGTRSSSVWPSAAPT
jgi:hypothetical protein